MTRSLDIIPAHLASIIHEAERCYDRMVASGMEPMQATRYLIAALSDKTEKAINFEAALRERRSFVP
jgi:hypothetical protein